MNGDNNSILQNKEKLKEYNSLIFSISRRMITNREVANDAAQEAWIEVINSLSKFQGESKLSTWIYTVASRVISKYANREKQYTTKFIRSCFHQEEFEAPVSESLEKKEWVKEMCDKCITGCLHCLSNEDRMIFILSELTDLTSIDLASIFNLKDKTIRKRVSRSRKKLNSFLRDECILYNPAGSCKCRMKNHVLDIDLPEEYKKIKKTVKEYNILKKFQFLQKK